MMLSQATSNARFRLVFISGCYILAWSIANHLNSVWGWLVALTFQAWVLCGLLSVVHECAHAHRGLFGNPMANKLIGRFTAVLLGLNYSLYRFQHMRHHRYLNTLNDPEPAMVINTPTDYLQYLLINPHFCLMSRQFVDSVLGRWDNPAFNGIDDKLRNEIQRDSYILLGWIFTVIILTIYIPIEISTIYLIPLFFSLVLDGFVSLPEHYELDNKQESSAGSRTITSNAFVRFVLWNVNYHVEHHKHPGATFNELPNIHEHLKSNCSNVEKSYLIYHWNLIVDLCKHKVTIAR